MALSINWLAVIAGTVGYQILGALWYGPLFGTRWMAWMGYGDDEGPSGDPRMGYLLTTVGSLVATGSLAVLLELAGATGWRDGLLIGGLVGIGFVATTELQALAFEERSWEIYLLNAGYNVLALAGIGVLLAVW